MKRVEFIGLSGSGKSTAIKILEEHLHSQDALFKKGDDALKISTKKKIIYLLIFSIKKLGLTYFILKEILKHTDKMFILKRFLRIFYSHEYLLQDEKLTLFDEGFVFLGYYFHANFFNENSFSEEKLQNYIEKIPKPDYLVYIQTHFQTAIKRMMSRSITHSVLNHNHEQVQTYYHNSFTYFEAVARALEKRGVKVITIYNNGKYSCLEGQLHKTFQEINFK